MLKATRVLRGLARRVVLQRGERIAQTAKPVRFVRNREGARRHEGEDGLADAAGVVALEHHAGNEAALVADLLRDGAVVLLDVVLEGRVVGGRPVRREHHGDGRDVDCRVGDFLDDPDEFGPNGGEAVAGEDEVLERGADFLGDGAARGDELRQRAEEVGERRARVDERPGAEDGRAALADRARDFLDGALEAALAREGGDVCVHLCDARAPQSAEGREGGDGGGVLQGPARDDDAAEEGRELAEEKRDGGDDVGRKQGVEAIGEEGGILAGLDLSRIVCGIPQDATADAQAESGCDVFRGSR